VKRSNRLVILVGVLLAVLAFVAIVVLLNQRETPQQAEEDVKAKVLVATRDIAIGDEVTPSDVEVVEVDPEAVSGTPLVDPSQLANRVALREVPAGAQVNVEVFGQLSGTVDIVSQLQPGEKAIAIQVDRVTGLDFLIKQGDQIDVVIAANIQVLQPTADSLANPDQPPRFETIPGLENARTVKTVLQDKRVLYVSETRIKPEEAPAASPTPQQGNQQGQQQEAPIERVIIVFAGTDADAELVKFAQRDDSELGAFSVVLRHPDDDAIEETQGLTIDALIERYAVPIPNIVEQLGEQTSPTP
jgi:Flp pilus assembly protein CpaB